MGLNCSHGAFDGPYSLFNRFRQNVASALGGSFPPHDKWARDDSGELMLEDMWYIDTWKEEQKPGIYLFLNHADDSGELTPSECRLVAKDLVGLRIAFTDEKFTGRRCGRDGWLVVLDRFIDGCNLAASKNEPLLFR